VCAFYGVDPRRGLSAFDVERARARYGRNELPAEEGKPLWKLVLKQFDDLLVKARAYLLRVWKVFRGWLRGAVDGGGVTAVWRAEAGRKNLRGAAFTKKLAQNQIKPIKPY
jgi:magnesium-transporting ATPase (P-type)